MTQIEILDTKIDTDCTYFIRYQNAGIEAKIIGIDKAVDKDYLIVVNGYSFRYPCVGFWRHNDQTLL